MHNRKTTDLTLERLQAAGAGTILSTSLSSKDAERENLDEKHADDVKDKSDGGSTVGAASAIVMEKAGKQGHSSGGDLESRGSTGARRGFSGMRSSYAFNLSELKRSLRHMDGEHFRALFGTRKMALNTSLVMLLWSMIGLAYP